MVTPTNLTIWLQDQAWPFAVIAAIAIFTYVALKLAAHNRRNTLAKERADITQETFTEYLTQYGFDATIASSTYRYLQETQNVSFPILASDNLDEDLGLDSEDVEQTVRDLTTALGRMSQPGLMQTHPITVEDLVRNLQASPRMTVMPQRRAAA